MKIISLFVIFIIFLCRLSFADEYIIIPGENDVLKVKNNLVSSLASGNEAVWIGTESGNLFSAVIDDNKWKITKVASTGNDKINSLFWADSVLLIGTEKCVFVFNPQKEVLEKIVETKSPVVNIGKLKNDFLCVTKNAIYKSISLSKNSMQEIKYTKENSLTIHSAFPAFDKMYIETDVGLVLVATDSEIPVKITKCNPLNGVRLLSGCYREGEMWFGTSYGLFSYKSIDSVWNKLAIDKDLPDVVILSSALYGQYLWLGTMRGPVCLNTETGQCAKELLPDTSGDIPINTITTLNNKIIFGVSGKGLLIKDINDIPYVSIKRLEWKNDSIIFHGSVFGSKLEKSAFFYSPNISPLLTIDAGLYQRQSEKSDELCVWNYNGINNGDYVVCAKVKNQNGVMNTTQYPITIKRHQIEVILDPLPEYTSDSKVLISGVCSNSFKPAIRLSPNGSDVQFQNEKMGFNGNVILSEGNNKVIVSMFDPESGSKLTDVFRYIVYDSTTPQVGIDSFFAVREPLLNITGRYSDKNPDRVEIYSGDDTLKCTAYSNSFNCQIKVKYGKTLLRLSAFDKAGNKSETKTEILFDTLAPRFTFIECPAYTNLDSVSITGFFDEENIASIRILPFDLQANIDLTSAKFSCKIPLHDGPNAIECVIKDRAVMVTNEKIWITADKIAPVIYVDSIPSSSSRPVISIAGKVDEKYFANITVSDSNILVDCNLNEHAFGFDWRLESGLNTISITAFDLAGNQTVKTISISYSGPIDEDDTIKNFNEMKETVSNLEKENFLLKKRIINYEESVKQESNLSVKNKNNYIIYKTKKDETLYYLSQKFYGNINNYWRIAELNNFKNKDLLLSGMDIKIPLLGENFKRSVWSDSAGSSFEKIRVSVGYMRLSPNVNASLAGMFVKDDLVEILEIKDDWYRVQNEQGIVGWIHNNLLEK